MKPLKSYINIRKGQSIIHANDDNIKKIVKDQIDKFGKNVDLNYINTSDVTMMLEVFDQTDFCGDVSKWDVSNVTSFRDMFSYCYSFNCDLGDWDTAAVTDMTGIFWACHSFTGQGLEKWDMSNVKKTNGMFYYCKKLTGDTIVGWNFKSLETTRLMFEFCISLNQDFTAWNTKNLFDTYNMFLSCTNLEYVPKWDLTEAHLVKHMFKDCTKLIEKKDFSNIKLSRKSYRTIEYNNDLEWLYSVMFDLGNIDIKTIKKAYPGIILPEVIETK